MLVKVTIGALAIALAACGGGGGGNSDTSTSTPNNPPPVNKTFSVALADVEATRVSNGDPVDVDTSGIGSGVLQYNPE